MLNKLMLDNKTAEKIEIYKKILKLDPGVYNFFNLSQTWEISYAKSFATVHEIDQELSDMRSGYPPLINQQQKVVILPDLPFAGAYKAYQIQQAIPFHFLNELLKEQYQTLEEFAANYHFSLSTVRRKLQPLVKFFRNYGVTIKLSSLRLGGDERAIRQVLATLMWECARNGAVFLSPLGESDVQQAIHKTLSADPDNEQISSMRLFKKIDANISYFRIRNGHFVAEDDRYDWILSAELINNAACWGEFLQIPSEHLAKEVQYMAFRQFFGTVFFEENDPLQQLPFTRLEANMPFYSHLMQKFRSFVEEEMLSCGENTVVEQENLALLWSNIFVVFINYLVYQTKLPFPCLMTESEDVASSTIFNSLYHKIRNFFGSYAGEPGLRWLSDCLEDMSKIFAVLLLPEYEEAADKFKLQVAILPEERFIALHRLESFLHSLSYVRFFPFEQQRLEECDVLIGSAILLEALNIKGILKCFELNEVNEGRSYQNLEFFLKAAYVEKNTYW